FLDASSARASLFSISASSKGENSFSFSPVVGLIEAIAMFLSKRGRANEQRWNALSSTRWHINAACRLILISAFGGRHRLEAKPIHLQAKPFWNQHVIEKLEEPLHKQREHSCGDRALQDRHVIVQV